MASAGVAVAATEASKDTGTRAISILAAALALPGLVSTARAEDAPEHGVVSVKYLSYRDRQPGLDRIKVQAPSIYALAPLGPRWAIEGSAVADSVSGASPRYHSAISSASHMGDERLGAEVKLTRYEARSAYAIGYAGSNEHDYRSNAVSGEARFASDDNNRTWNIGLGYSRDRVTSVNDPTLQGRKRTIELVGGVTQAVSSADLVQLNLTVSRGRCLGDPIDPNPASGARRPSCYSDPYKVPDLRPHERDQNILLARWNHHIEGWGSTLRSSYRYYSDSYRIHAHTLGAEWVQPVGAVFTITPSLRLYSQSSAKFYYDPVYDVDNPGYPPGFFTNPPPFAAADQRLSAFGAVTVGLKLGVRFSPDWSADVKGEVYEQRSNWRVGGPGSPGLDPFKAVFLQAGVSRRF